MKVGPAPALAHPYPCGRYKSCTESLLRDGVEFEVRFGFRAGQYPCRPLSNFRKSVICAEGRGRSTVGVQGGVHPHLVVSSTSVEK